jgi:hypothetical protein
MAVRVAHVGEPVHGVISVSGSDAGARSTADWYIHFNDKAAREAAEVAPKLVEGWDSNPAVSLGTVGVNAGQARESMVSSCK